MMDDGTEFKLGAKQSISGVSKTLAMLDVEAISHLFMGDSLHRLARIQPASPRRLLLFRRRSTLFRPRSLERAGNQ
jgi:hypothetical protein